MGSAFVVKLSRLSYLHGQFDLAESLLQVSREAEFTLDPRLQAILEKIVRAKPAPIASIEVSHG